MSYLLLYFFFHDTATTEIYTLSLHDALPIFPVNAMVVWSAVRRESGRRIPFLVQNAAETAKHGSASRTEAAHARSEEHTSELQSQSNLVCRLLLEKKK